MKGKWDSRFMAIAQEVAKWSSCLRHNVGCVIVKDKKIVATGYNGAPCGITTCKDNGFCYKNSVGIESGPINCFATHAEQNALMQSAKYGISINESTLYCTHKPCNICLKLIINAGITRVVYEEEYEDTFASKLYDMSSNLTIEKFDSIK